MWEKINAYRIFLGNSLESDHLEAQEDDRIALRWICEM
jgi:hypothetical protein